MIRLAVQFQAFRPVINLETERVAVERACFPNVID
jgi:hypothetical protein